MAGGAVTTDRLSRGLTPGDLKAPYVSQFLLRRINFGTLRITQRQRTANAAQDYMIAFNEWLSVQNGEDVSPASPGTFDPVRRYIRTMRDLATHVHCDALYEAYLNDCLILLDLGTPLDPGHPRLTAGDELNKLAANMSIGRNMAGVHWRNDSMESIKPGETVAIELMREQKLCFNESSGLGLTRFDGSRVVIQPTV